MDVSAPNAGPPDAWLPPGENDALRIVSDAVRDAYHGMRSGRVAPVWTLAETRARVEAIPIDQPVGGLEAIREAAMLMEHGDLRSASARCFGFFNPTPGWPSVLADLLAGARNPQACLATHAPASVAMERRVIHWMLSRLGFPDGSTGHFTSGGSEANATALIVALAKSDGRYVAKGVRGFDGDPVVYASRDSHLAWIKIARATGMGADAVRFVPTDGTGRMCIDSLRARIQADMGVGAIPIMIIATAGTTNAGEIDPLAACRDVADEYGLHLHVDAAWAGALVIDDGFRDLLEGIATADSVTIDAHKWLSVTMGAGMVFLKDAATAARAFGVGTGYMPAGDGVDPYLTTNQWSRRFVGLRLWMMLRTGGLDAYRRTFDRQFALAETLRSQLKADGWTVRNQSPLPIVLFEDAVSDCDSRSIADVLNERGGVWVGCVEYEGRTCLRACMTSFLTDEDDVAVLVASLNTARDEVAGG